MALYGEIPRGLQQLFAAAAERIDRFAWADVFVPVTLVDGDELFVFREHAGNRVQHYLLPLASLEVLSDDRRQQPRQPGCFDAIDLPRNDIPRFV